LDVTDILPINDNVVAVTYMDKKENRKDRFDNNILIAMFTTSNARIRLFCEMDKLGERVLYCDTGK
jgi:hypothetical protein